MNAPISPAQQESAYLAQLGQRVRTWRGGQGVTRKALAIASGVSERYLAQLEAGLPAAREGLRLLDLEAAVIAAVAAVVAAKLDVLG